MYAIVGSISDSRYKKEVSPLPYGLDEVMQMNPIKYKYDLPEENMLARDDDFFLGFSAQEMQTLVPETVHERLGELGEGYHTDEMLAMTMDEVVPVTVNAIKQLNDKLDTEIAYLQAQIDELKNK